MLCMNMKFERMRLKSAEIKWWTILFCAMKNITMECKHKRLPMLKSSDASSVAQLWQYVHRSLKRVTRRAKVGAIWREEVGGSINKKRRSRGSTNRGKRWERLEEAETPQRSTSKGWKEKGGEKSVKERWAMSSLSRGDLEEQWIKERREEWRATRRGYRPEDVSDQER